MNGRSVVHGTPIRYGKGRGGDAGAVVERPKKLKPSHFIGRLTKIFEGYMNVYVDAQERNLETMLESFAEQFKAEGVGSPDDLEEGEGGPFPFPPFLLSSFFPLYLFWGKKKKERKIFFRVFRFPLVLVLSSFLFINP